MAADIAPALYERVRAVFGDLIAADRRATALYEAAAAGKATYAEAQKFARRVGELLGQALRRCVSSDELPNGRMYYNIAERVLRPLMEADHALVADVAVRAQESMNAAAGIGMKAVTPTLNESRVQGLLDEVSDAEHYDDAAPRLYDQLTNFSQSVVDDAVRENADTQWQAGLSPKIVRTAAAGCCQWCSDVAGVYDYAEVSDTGNDVFCRHTNCNCTVEYDPGGGRRQNVHTKRWAADREPAKIEARKAVRVPDDRRGARSI